MKLFTIDFETYYDREFSLSKLTTEEYIRGDEFEVIGVAVQEDDGEPVWFSGSHKETRKFLESFDLQSNIALAHNAMFDAAILGWHFGIRPRSWFDTLSMARAVHGTEVGGSLATLATYYSLGVKGDEVINALGKKRNHFTAADLDRYGQYCKNDVALTYKLCGELVANFPKSELQLIDLTIRMFSEPTLYLDPNIIRVHLAEVRERRTNFVNELRAYGYTQKDLMSNPKFAELLRRLGVEPPTKVSLTTNKDTWAFAKNDEQFKALLEHEDEVVQMVVAARLGMRSTLEESRAERFMAISERGPMPVPLRYYAAHTGRWGGDDKVNLQNLPRNSPLKSAIVAPSGYLLIDSDSSQIEARMLAWLAEQKDLVKSFEDGVDVYVNLASKIYNKPAADIQKSERFVGKTTILGAGYGMGAKKFSAQLKTFKVELPEDECQHIIKTYRETYPQIPKLWRKANSILDSIIDNTQTELGRNGTLQVDGKKGIRLPNGLYLKYPNLRKVINEEGDEEYVYDSKRGKATVATRIYGGKVVENVCQALARIVIGDQMRMIAKKYRVVMTVHDAIACLVPEEEAKSGKEFVELCMRMRPKWAPELPLNCEAGYGQSYGDC